MASNVLVTNYKRLNNKVITNVDISFNGNITNGRALWDTGATICSISYDVVKKINLSPVAKDTVSTPGGLIRVNEYLVDIILSKDITIKDVRVCSTKIGNQGLEMIIGMDIIMLGDFAISNFNNETKFSFRMPTAGEINL